MDVLGYRNFCMACRYSRNENGEMVCRGENSSFYGLPVKNVLNAPCIKKEAGRPATGRWGQVMTCSICGRKLSNPKSIELGYGPVCYEKVSGSSKAAKKVKAGTSHPAPEVPCYDIPGQMELKDYLSDL